MDFKDIEYSLDELLFCFERKIPADRLLDCREENKAGEPGIAFENLCSNLDDFRITITSQQLFRLREIGTAMKIRSDYWERLIVKDEE